MRKKITFIMIWLVLLSSVILAQEQEVNEEMTQYVWLYSKVLKRSSTTGNVGLTLTAGEGQSIEILSIYMADTATPHETKTAYINDLGSQSLFLFSSAEDPIYYPNNNLIGTLGYYSGRMVFFGGESIYLQCSSLTTSETIAITIRGTSNIYDLPSESLLAGCEVNTNLGFKIIGVID